MDLGKKSLLELSYTVIVWLLWTYEYNLECIIFLEFAASCSKDPEMASYVICC